LPTAAGITAYLAFVGLRVWQFHGHGVGIWPDSTGYAATAHAGWFSLDLWAGDRAPGLPLAIKLTGQHFDVLIDVQFVASALAWMAVAWVVGQSLRPGWPRWLCSGLVLGFALTGPITLWDRQLLTESLSLTFLAATFAASFWFTQKRTWPRAIVLLATVVAWVAMRDAHGVPIAIAGLVVVSIVVIMARPGSTVDTRVIVIGFALVLIAGVARAGADHSARNLQPISNVYAVRVLPFRDRLDWFADHGMPQRARLEAMARSARLGDAPGARIVSALAGEHSDPLLAPYFGWLRGHGETTLLRYAVTHPGYLFTEPFERPERGFNNAGGWSGYVPGHRRVPLVDRILFPPWPFVLVLFVVACAIAAWRRLRSWEWWLAFGWAALGFVALAAAWHADGQELSRHVLVPDVQIRLATFVALALAVNAIVTDARERPSTPRPAPGRRRRDAASSAPAMVAAPGIASPPDAADTVGADAADPGRGSPGTS
jgi:hypothetical protein